MNFTGNEIDPGLLDSKFRESITFNGNNSVHLNVVNEIPLWQKFMDYRFEFIFFSLAISYVELATHIYNA